jgi:DNA-binding transcriptional MocR family regulator
MGVNCGNPRADPARTLHLSRNTVLAAYDELKPRGLLRGRRGARMHVVAPSARPGLNVRLVMREAQYPLRTLAVRDQVEIRS